MVDNTEKKKAPFLTWFFVVFAVGLLVMLAIGVWVL